MSKTISKDVLKKIQELIRDSYPFRQSFNGVIRISPSSNRREDLEIKITSIPCIIEILDIILLTNEIVPLRDYQSLRISLKRDIKDFSSLDSFEGFFRISPSSRNENDIEIYISSSFETISILDKILIDHGLIAQKELNSLSLLLNFEDF